MIAGPLFPVFGEDLSLREEFAALFGRNGGLPFVIMARSPGARAGRQMPHDSTRAKLSA